MGYDLIARNKKAKIKEFAFGLFSWPILLQETGMGYVIGYGPSMEPNSYNYIPRTANEGSPVSNDGYIVTSSQAKAMALVAKGFVSSNRFINNQWSEIPEERQIEMRKAVNYNRAPLYRQWYSEEHLVKLEKFAEFANQSGGFTIN